METSCPGVFAIGDVSNPRHPCTATALASGTVAARQILSRLSSTAG
jgi:thioredoxin reductase